MLLFPPSISAAPASGVLTIWVIATGVVCILSALDCASCGSPSPVNALHYACVVLSGYEPLHWVHWAIDGLCKPHIIDYFMDQTFWPFKWLIASELGFDKDSVKGRPAIR